MASFVWPFFVGQFCGPICLASLFGQSVWQKSLAILFGGRAGGHGCPMAKGQRPRAQGFDWDLFIMLKSRVQKLFNIERMHDNGVAANVPSRTT